nr:alkylglycerol monooxygenase-like [Penaeus vannamei]
MASVTQRLGYLFYAVNPKSTLFKHPEEVPRYENETLFVILALVVIELAYRVCHGRQLRANEIITSLAIGLLHETTVFISEGAILLGYEWLYQYRVLDFQWDSLYTWWAAFFFVDFLLLVHGRTTEGQYLVGQTMANLCASLLTGGYLAKLCQRTWLRNIVYRTETSVPVYVHITADSEASNNIANIFQRSTSCGQPTKSTIPPRTTLSPQQSACPSSSA